MSPDRVLPIVHVGYTTAGSSWLRRNVFCSAQFGLRLAINRQQVYESLILPHPLEFDAVRVRRAWHEQLIAQSTVPVISHERLAGSAHSTGYDSLEILRRLEAVLGECRVLFVVRRQEDLLFSSYDRYIRHGHGALPLNRYLSPTQRGRGALPPRSHAFFEYDRLVSRYRSTFGEENVLVAPIEAFSRRPGQIVRAIDRMVGRESRPDGASAMGLTFIDPTRRPTVVAVSRIVNAMLVDGQHNPCPPLRLAKLGVILRQRGVERLPRVLTAAIDRVLDASWRDQIRVSLGDRTLASNRRLQVQTRSCLRCAAYSGVEHHTVLCEPTIGECASSDADT